MNTIYKLVRHATTGKCVVASELAKGRKKTGGIAAAITVALALSMGAGAAMATEDASSTETQISECASDDLDASTGCVGSSSIRSTGARAGITQANSPIGVQAALDDTYVQITPGSGATAASASNNGSMAIGSGAVASGLVANAIGYFTNATGTAALAVGDQAKATANYATAIGFEANAAGTAALAVGDQATAAGNNSTAMGFTANAGAVSAIALGNAATVNAGATNSMALGTGATVNANITNAVALGASAVANRNNTVSVGNGTTNSQIVNMAAGTQGTDAVNVSQLSSVAAALGGGAEIDPTTGMLKDPTYTLANGGTSTNIADALTGLDDALTAANANVTANTSNIATNASDITDLKNDLGSGTIGLVQQATGTADLTVGASTGGNAVNFSGTAGDRVLTGVANAVNGNDAVTLAQLEAIGLVDRDGEALGAVVYTDATLSQVTLGGTNGTLLTNLAPGQIASGSTDAINGGQISDLRDQLQGQIGSLDGRVGAIESGIADGSIGGPGTGGPGDGVGNDAGGNAISNVGTGVAPTDAANVGQVNALVQESIQAANAYTDNRVDAVSQSLDQFKGDVNNRFNQQDVRISRVGAMSAAMSQMAFSTQGINTPNRIGVGVGNQGGKSAIAAGYSRSIRPNLNVTFGGSASGSEVNAGIGVGMGW
ncbi:MAG: ESPR-type extended signal peptide-containing protein [Rhodanobacter sp.]